MGDAPDRLQTAFALHELTKDERATCDAMLGEERAALAMMPTHHIGDLGDLAGFRFDCPPYATGSALPLTRTMFHGHTLVECQADEKTVLALMSDPAANRQRMLDFLSGVERDCVPATLDCIPENASAVTPNGVLQAQAKTPPPLPLAPR